MTKLEAVIFCALLIAFSTLAVAKDACEVPTLGANFDDVKYPVALSGAWSDEKLLDTIGLKIGEARIQKDEGPDGFGMTYRFSKASVIISRSNLNQVAVLLSFKDSPGGAVHWELCSHTLKEPSSHPRN